MRTALSPVASLIAASTAVLLVAACAAQTSGSSTTVNALWYGKQKDGSVAQGVTKVTIDTTESNWSGFKVDLSGFESASAGAYWNSAAKSAAAVAVLTSVADPRDLTVSFGVEEKIDGPSAGGLLAAGIRADLSSLPIPVGKTMTGTILPNGGIGPVGGIPAKLRAAKDAGITTVLIPKGQTTATDPATGKSVNLIDAGRELGVEVREVASVVEATDQLVGTSQNLPQSDPGPISAGLLSVVRRAANEALVDVSRTPLDSSNIPSLVRARPTVAQQVAVYVAKAKSALAAEDPIGALTSASAAARLSYAWNARSAAVTQATNVGAPKATEALAGMATDLGKLIETRIATASQTPTQFDEQAVGLADALSWGTDAIARTTSVNSRLQKPSTALTPTILGTEAADLAESRYNSDFMLNTAVAALATTGKKRISDADATTSFLGSYADFLADAAEANGRYFEEIAEAAGGELAQDKALQDDLQVVTAGRDRWESVKSGSSAPEVAVKLSQAISRYIDSTVLIATSGVAAATNDTSATSRIEILDSAALTAQRELATETTAREARVMSASGLDSSYPRWSDSWGSGLTRLAGADGSADQSELEGLVYQWFANIQAAITVALTKATS